MSMRLKREGDWIEYTTEKGKSFFYNEKDGAFQWESPFATVPVLNRSDTQKKQRAANVDSTSEQRQTQAVHPDVDLDAESSLSAAISPRTPIYSAWKPYVDEATGAVFWYNEETKVSQWENPFEENQQVAGFVENGAMPTDYTEINNGLITPLELNADDHEGAVAVVSEHDLGL